MKCLRIYFFLLIFSLASLQVFAAVLKESTEDKNHDGKIDHWYWRDPKNHLVRQAVDNNGDGRPDQFYTFIHGGRDFVIREYDRNFDGKIDKRLLAHWDAGKTIPVMTGTRMTRIANPGYVAVWKEEDNNFDEVIDAYVDKRDKTKTKIGQKIDASPAPAEQGEIEEPTKKSGPKQSEGEARIERLNERLGLQS